MVYPNPVQTGRAWTTNFQCPSGDVAGDMTTETFSNRVTDFEQLTIGGQSIRVARLDESTTFTTGGRSLHGTMIVYLDAEAGIPVRTVSDIPGLLDGGGTLHSEDTLERAPGNAQTSSSETAPSGTPSLRFPVTVRVPKAGTYTINETGSFPRTLTETVTLTSDGFRTRIVTAGADTTQTFTVKPDGVYSGIETFSVGSCATTPPRLTRPRAIDVGQTWDGNQQCTNLSAYPGTTTWSFHSRVIGAARIKIGGVDVDVVQIEVETSATGPGVAQNNETELADFDPVSGLTVHRVTDATDRGVTSHQELTFTTVPASGS